MFFALAIVSSAMFSQQGQNTESGVIVASQFGITRPLSEIFKENPVDESQIVKEKKQYESADRLNRIPQKFVFTAEKDGDAYGNAKESMQNFMGNMDKGQNKANWAGQSASGFRPYDPSGAVGLNHYIQMINSTTFKVYDKTSGTVLLTATLGNLWSPATANAGDPIVMYDKAVDRWFLAQFGSGNNNIYIAVSTTGNPLGTYYTYTFTSPQFPDYLKFGIWNDGYYMTSNQGTQKVFVFERTAMLAGTPGARSVYTNYAPLQGGGFFCPLPADAGDGTLPTAGTPCPIVSYSDNAWGGTATDAIQLYNMTVNWVPATPTATISFVSAVPTAAFDASYESTWNNCSQPGTTQKLDGIGGVLMYRAQWKSWGSYNTLVLNWAVKISATQRSIKWAELRQNITTGVWSVYQEGIYTPDASTRWLGSIAMDNNGSIGLSYIKSDATSIYPGLYWTGRRSCDPLGTMPITETLVVAGTGFQTGTNRVGDYAHTSLDPDGVTFWSTSEYMGGASGASAARTRIFSYSITSCTTDAGVSIVVSSGSNPTCAGANITFTALPVNGGTAPSYQWKLNGNNVGTNSATYSSAALGSGDVVTCVMTSNLAGVTANPATSNAITISVNASVTPSVSIALTSGTNPTCPGVAVTFTATPTNGGTTPSYQWQVNGVNAGTNSATFTTTTITNGQTVTCVMTSAAPCPTIPAATSNGITVTITSASSPTVTITQTTGSNPTCGGATNTFTATVTNGNSPSYQWKVNGVNVGTNSPTYTTTTLTNGQTISCTVSSAAACPSFFTLGTGTVLNATTSDLAAAYPTYYGSGRQQYLITAAELTALGMTAGNISSLGFTINSTVGDPATLNGYTIKMGATAATAMTTTFLSASTTVFGPVNYTPTTNATNTHNFTTPFTWNGTSNVVVDLCFSNQVVGNGAYQSYRSNSSFVSTAYYQADGAAGAGACTQATGGATGSIRPNMVFSLGGGTTSVNSNVITMNVTSTVTPAVSIAVTTGSNPTCAGVSVTFTATPTNGGTTPSYQWKLNGSNVGTNSAAYTNAALANNDVVTCVMTSSSSCASPTTATSNAITVTVNNPTTYYRDNDGDGFGTPGTSTVSCTPVIGYVTNSTDCNDNNAAVNPGVTENLCNGIDDNCNGTIDEGRVDGCTNSSACNYNAAATCDNGSCVLPTTWYLNADGDNYYASTQSSCSSPGAGWVNTAPSGGSGDCNDSNAAINPGATENLCNGIDDNCNGTIDEGRVNGCTNSTACNYNPAATCDNGSCTFATTWYLNADGDNYYASTQTACTSPGAGWVNTAPTGGSGDCNDNNAAVHPGATENLCNGIDDNCNGTIDEGRVNGCTNSTACNYNPAATCDNGSCTFATTWYLNADGDNYYTSTQSACTSPGAGWVNTAPTGGSGDCNDNNAAINPGAAEICGNGIDDNCAGGIDEGCCTLAASASANSTSCATSTDGSVNLTTTGGALPLTYLWSNGATTEDISNVGTGTYSVTVTDAYNCVVTTSATVSNSGSGLPAQATAINGPVGACKNQTGVVFTVAPLAGATSYLWTLPTGATGTSTTNSITLSFSTSFNGGNICVTGVNACGQGAQYCRSVIVYSAAPAAPVAILGGNSGACPSTSITYSIAPVANATSYTWTAPTNSTVTAGQGTTTATITFASNFGASGTLYVKATNCVGNSANKSMVVYGKPATPGTITGPITGVCGGTTQNYSIAAVNGATGYNWTVPAGAVINSGQGSTAINVTFPVTYSTGSVSVSASSVCGTSALRTVTVGSVPSLPATITGQATNICGAMSLTYTVPAVTGAISYNWTAPAGCTITANTGTSVTISYPSTFVTGTLCYTVTNACGTSASRCVSVTNKPATPASISGSASVCPSAQNLVYTTPQVGAFTYTWTVPASCTIVSGQGTNSVTVNWGTAAGILYVKANNACGSSANKSLSVTLLTCFQGAGNSEAAATPLLESLNIYPNPSSGNFTIESPFSGDFVIQNEMGQIVRSFKLNNDNAMKINVTGLTTGLYFIIGMHEGQVVTQKILVTY